MSTTKLTTKLTIDPNAPNTAFILGAAFSGGDVRRAAQLASGATVSQVGAGPLSIIREFAVVSGGDSIWSFTANPQNPPLVGYGSTPKEAAKHLADQLREYARLVEASEGQ